MKHYLYDLGTLNKEIFEYINAYINAHDHIIVSIGHYVAAYQNFPLMILLFLLYIYCKLRTDRNLSSQGASRPEIASKLWQSFFTFFITVFTSIIIVGIFKEIFAYSRPFCTDGVIVTSISQEVLRKVNCFQSFPSGHTNYISALIFGSWSILSRLYRITGIVLIFFIALSRMAAGVHFPADVFWGAVIAIVLSIIAHKFSAIIWRKLRLKAKNNVK